MLIDSRIAWGPVSEWFSGIATALAVTVALIFSVRTERQQRDAALAAVHAWFELHADNERPPQKAGVLWLVNDTDYPIYQWRVSVTWALPDGTLHEVTTGQADHGLLPPGRHHFDFRTSERVVLPDNDAEIHVDLRFLDAGSSDRHRLPTGQLSRR